jgi:hypothetical protein
LCRRSHRRSGAERGKSLNFRGMSFLPAYSGFTCEAGSSGNGEASLGAAQAVLTTNWRASSPREPACGSQRSADRHGGHECEHKLFRECPLPQRRIEHVDTRGRGTRISLPARAREGEAGMLSRWGRARGPKVIVLRPCSSYTSICALFASDTVAIAIKMVRIGDKTRNRLYGMSAQFNWGGGGGYADVRVSWRAVCGWCACGRFTHRRRRGGCLDRGRSPNQKVSAGPSP